MNKVEKIKAEIERLKNELIQEAEKGYKSEFDEGRISAFEDMITFIDSIEEEPISNDLEEAARKAATWHSRVRGDEFFPNDYQKFIAGAQWQKEQMIEKACKWLSNVSIEDMTYKYNDFDTSEDWYKFIKDFKKVMEE